MSEPNPPPLVFVSHSQADAASANALELLLNGLGVKCWNFNSAMQPGDNYLEKVKSVLESCTHIVVLVGPFTKDSRWVDMEMEVAMASRADGPGAALIGVILSNHADFKKPFYDPELVPLRLHEFVSQQAALLKKWDEKPAAWKTWLDEAANRRLTIHRRARVSLATLRLLREHQWTNEGDEPREALFELSAQHRRDLPK